MSVTAISITFNVVVASIDALRVVGAIGFCEVHIKGKAKRKTLIMYKNAKKNESAAALIIPLLITQKKLI